MGMDKVLRNKLKKSIKFKIFKKAIKEMPFYFLDYLIIFYSTLKNIILERRLFKKNVVIISASDKYFAESLFQLLDNISNLGKISKIIIYDLGLEKLHLDKIQKYYPHVIVKKFDFSDYPKFFIDRDEYNRLGSYAWKPAIIYKEMNINQCQIIWLDTGNLVDKKFNLVRIVLSAIGFFSPISAGNLREYTYIKTLESLDVPMSMYKKRMLTGGFIGFDWESKKAMKILDKWNSLSHEKSLISPENSTISNHKEDQSLLSSVVYLSRSFLYLPKIKKVFGIKVNQNPNRFFYLLESEENSIAESVRDQWYKNFGRISTRTIKESKIVWITSLSKLNKITNPILKEKIIIASVFEDEVENFNQLLFMKKINNKINHINFFLTTNKELNQSLEQNDYETILIPNIEINSLKKILEESLL